MTLLKSTCRNEAQEEEKAFINACMSRQKAREATCEWKIYRDYALNWDRNNVYFYDTTSAMLLVWHLIQFAE